MGRVASEGYDQARKAKDGGIRALKIGFVKMGKKRSSLTVAHQI